VPVSCSESRITQSSGVDGGSSTETGLPFTVNEIKEYLLPFECELTVLDVRQAWSDATLCHRAGDALAQTHAGTHNEIIRWNSIPGNLD
jgi:hypothetical protein